MMKNKKKIITMIDEMVEMLPTPKHLVDPDGGPKSWREVDWMVLALDSLKELVVGKNLSQIEELRPDLIKEQALKIVDDALIAADREDLQHKRKMIMEGKGEKAVGNSWLIFNLTNIRNLIEENE